MLDLVSQKSKYHQDLILIADSNNIDWGHIIRIAEVFQLWIVPENYAEMEAKCFEAALEACKEKKWALINRCHNDISKITDVAGKTLFMQAVGNWDKECVKELLQYKSLVYQKDGEGNTALHIAAQKGAIDLLPILFECLSFDIVNNAGETPVQIAIFHGQEQVLKVLIENGANLKAFVWKTLKMTPLCFSVLRGETECVDCLLNRNNFRQSIGEIGNLLHIAIHFHQTSMIEHLLEKPYMRDLLEEPNDNDLTPLAYAASLGEVEAVWTLEKKGANLEAKDSQDRTPLHHAALSSQLEVIKLLASFKVSPLAVDRQGKTPLVLAESKKDESFDALETYHLLYNLLNTWGSISFSKHSSYSSPENFAFKGGGAKGEFHVGVIKFLAKRKKLEAVKRVSGTSSGAITATFVALGYSVEKIEDLLLNKNLMDFIDDPLCKVAIEEFTTTDPKLATTLLGYYRSIYGKAKVGGSLILDIFKKMNKTTGICTGESFRLWMENEIIATQVAEITGKTVEECKFYTFGEHRKLIQGGNKILKHIKVYGTKLGPNLEIVEFSSEDPKCDNYIFSDLIRISMSIPEVFESHYIYIKQGKDRVFYEEGGVYVDGGVLYNLPVEAFDQKRYQTQQDLGPEGRCPQFNKKTLGVNLVSSEQLQYQQEPKTMGDILIGIAKAYYSAETTIRNLNTYNNERIIEIDVGDVTTLSFNRDKKQKEDSIQRGFEQTERFFSKFDDSTSTDSIFSIPSREKRIKNRIDLPSCLPNFSGRKSELSILKRTFLPGNWKASHSLCVKIISGPGGIGKSELAITFGNKNEEHFSLIWFISCESHILYEQSYRELAQALKIPCKRDPLTLVIRKVNKTLEGGIDGKRPWLLILDNVEAAIKSDILPQRGGCVLMTTQDKTIWNHSSDFIELLPLSDQDCQDFFKQMVKEDPSQAMNDLIKELGGYPILLSLAAQSIYPYQSVHQYLQKVQTEGAPLWEIDEGSRYPKALGFVFSLHVQQIQKANPLAFEFLELCAFLNPDHISVQFLEFWLKQKKVGQERVTILKVFCDNSLFRYDKFKEILTLHRLHQKMLKAMVQPEKLYIVFDYLNEWARGYKSQPDDVKILKIGEGCFLHVDEMQKNSLWNNLNEAIKANLFSVCGSWLMDVKGDYKQGLKFHQQALDIRKICLGENNLHTASSYNYVGKCHDHQDDHALGLKFHEKAIEIMKDKKVDYDIAIFAATFYDNLAECLGNLGRYEEAEKRSRVALKLRKTYVGEKSLVTVTSYNNLGAILMKRGLHEKALENFEIALAIYKESLESLGEEHYIVALILCNIGDIDFQCKLPEKALEKFMKSLAILKKTYPKGHNDIIAPYRGLLLALFDLKRYQESLTYLEEFLPILKKFYGEEHPNVVECYANIGTILTCLGRPKEALVYHQKALEMYNKVLGENNIYAPGIIENIRITQLQIQYSEGGSRTGWFMGGCVLITAFLAGGYFYFGRKKGA